MCSTCWASVEGRDIGEVHVKARDITETTAGGARCRAFVQVTVNGHSVTLPEAGVAGVEVKQEAVAQGAVLELGFDLWVDRGSRWARVYDEDVIAIREGQEFLAITSDDHGDSETGGDHVVPCVVNPPADGWSLVVAPRLWTRLSQHLLTDGDDHAAVILADRVAGPRGPRLLARELIPAVDDADYCEGSEGYWSLSSAFIRDAVVRARDEQLAYLAIHSHRGTTTVGFSRIDLASHERGYPTLRQVTGQLVGALVLTPMAAAGDLWLPDGTRASLAEVVVPGHNVLRLHPRPIHASSAGPKHRRQALVLGDSGQEVLARLRVGVVGLGGVGSMVVELLSRLGVGELVLIDGGRIRETDLARLVAAEPGDLGRPKMDLAVRNATRANPEIGVTVIRGRVEDPAARDVLTRCDWIFLTTDDHAARHWVNELVHRYLIPATQADIEVPVNHHGGADQAQAITRLLLPGRDCLWCNGLIDPTQLAIDVHLGREREPDIDGEDVTAPAIITLDAMAAAEAVNHFTRAVTGSHAEDIDPEEVLDRAGGSDQDVVEPSEQHGCPTCAPDRSHVYRRHAQAGATQRITHPRVPTTS